MTYPICGHCTRLNLVCKREAPRGGIGTGGHGKASSLSGLSSFGLDEWDKGDEDESGGMSNAQAALSSFFTPLPRSLNPWDVFGMEGSGMGMGLGGGGGRGRVSDQWYLMKYYT